MAAQYAKDQPTGFKNRIENVAVVGASGTMGSAITKALLKTGNHVITALTRVGSKSVMPQGVKVAHIDYAKPETIVEALRGQDFLVITLSFRAPPETSVKLFKAAQAAGLHYVMPNCYGASPFSGNMYEEMGLGVIRQRIIDMLAYGLKPVVLSCGFWYQFSIASGPACYGFDIVQRKVILFDEGTVKTHTSTWPQCGRAAAALLSLPVLPEDATDTRLTLTAYTGTSKITTAHISSFEVSQLDMFASLKRVTSTTDADWTITHEPVKERYANAVKLRGVGGLSLDGVTPISPFEVILIAMYVCVFFPGGDGLTDDDLANRALGLPQEDLDTCTAEAVQLANDGVLDNYAQE